MSSWLTDELTQDPVRVKPRDSRTSNPHHDVVHAVAPINSELLSAVEHGFPLVGMLGMLHEGVLVVDLDGVIVYTNSSACEMFGYQDDGLTGTALDKLLCKSTTGGDDQWIRSFAESQEIFMLLGGGRPIDCHHRDGSDFRADVAIASIVTDSGLRVVAILRDLSDIDSQREERRLVGDQMLSILEASTDWLFLLDGDGRVVRTNSASATSGSGRRPSDEFAPGSSFVDVLRVTRGAENSASIDQIEGALDDVLAQRSRTRALSTSYATAAGTSWLSILISAMGGRPGALITIRDVTDSKLAEFALEAAKEQAVVALEELQRTQGQLIEAENLRSIGSLAAGVAHEINTPLQYVTDNINFLKDMCCQIRRLGDIANRLAAEAVPSAALDEYRQLEGEGDLTYLLTEGPEAITDSIEGLAQVSNIVKAMKQFAHPGGEQIVPSDLNNVIRTMTTVTRSEWKYLAELELDLGDGLEEVPLATGPFSQVMLNLMINAAHAIADSEDNNNDSQGTISISTRRVGDVATVKVTDTGRGMSEDTTGRIWDPFFTTKEVGRGTGQGLAISRRIVLDQHKGRISVDSEPGHGTTFTIEVPMTVETDHG